MSSISDKRAIYQVIGCLMKKPSLLTEERYKLTKDDFPEQFHKIIFAAINNLVAQGLEDIDYVMIDSFLSNYDVQYKIFNDNDGIDYLLQASENSSVSNFDYNYNRVKKFSLLRSYKETGLDINEIYNEDIFNPREKEEMQERFDQYTLQDIIDIIDKKILEVKSQFLDEYGAHGQQAGKGMKKLKEDLKQTPAMGAPLCSGILTTIVRGARLKKLYMRSAPTGVGKCIKGDTLIYTDKGLLEIQEIPKYYHVNNHEVTANIVSYDLEDGSKQILPTSHWYNMGQSKTIKIVSSMGYEIEGTPEHPIVVGDDSGDVYFKKLKDITFKDKIIISLNNGLFGTNQMSLNLSYLLGFLTGDGYLNTEKGIRKRNHLSYSKADSLISLEVNKMLKDELQGVNEIKSRATRLSVDHDFGNNETISFLETECGLTMNTAKYKKVPKTVLTGTKEVVVSFLQGLFDTDGSITRKTFEYSTASKKLAEQVHILLLNLGIVSKRRIKYVNETEYYIISIHNYPMLKKFAEEISFRLATDKQKKLQERLMEGEHYNSNNDLVYGSERLELLHVYLKDNVDEYKYNKRKSDNYRVNGLTFYESMKNGHKVSRERINAIVGRLETLPVELEYLRNSVSNLFFDQITDIAEGECEVFDFTVPVTHAFVANGTISHNTRLSLGDACNLAVNQIYDNKQKKWVRNGTSEPTLFITTELEMDEVQTPLIAFVSGVDEDKILDGSYSDEEEARIDKAIEIIENSPLWIEHLPNFDINDVERTIHKYVIDKKVKYAFFDYVHTSLKLLQELSQQSKGMRLREDNVLLMFVDRLKSLCNKLGVFIFSATQVSGDWENVKEANQNMLRGAKSMADKLDAGIIARTPSKSDLDALKPILSKGFMKEPNIVFDIYKNRGNKLVRVRLWSYVDLGTCRTEDLFLTNGKYELIPIESTIVEMFDDDEVEKDEDIDTSDI